GTARRDRPRDRDRPLPPGRRRADWRPRPPECRRDPRPARTAQPRVPEDHRHGYPRPARGPARQPRAPSGQGQAGGRRCAGRSGGSRVMKYLHYIYRNARRSPVRSLLTIASTAVTLFLMMILVSFISINGEVADSLKVYNRIVAMNSQGFAGRVPIVRVR